MSKQPHLTVVYDGHCAICLAGMEKLRKMFGDQVREMDFRIVPPQEIHPDLTEELCKAQMHALIGDKVYGGAEAMVKIMSLHPFYRWPLKLYYLPPLGWLSELLYGVVARNRFTLSKWLGKKQPVCTDSCSIHQPPKKKTKK